MFENLSRPSEVAGAVESNQSDAYRILMACGVILERGSVFDAALKAAFESSVTEMLHSREALLQVLAQRDPNDPHNQVGELLDERYSQYLDDNNRVRRSINNWQNIIRNTVNRVNSNRNYPILTEEEMASELSLLQAEFGAYTFDPATKILSVTTESIILHGFDFGQFTLSANLETLSYCRAGVESFSHVEAVALTPKHPRNRESITHPHVSDNSVCMGNAARAIERAYLEMRLVDYFELIRSILRTYSPDSPYAVITTWLHPNSCTNCLEPAEDIRNCDRCDRECCSICAGICKTCDGSFCSEHSSSCGACDATVCDRCYIYAEDEVFCRECGIVCSECDYGFRRPADGSEASVCPSCVESNRIRAEREARLNSEREQAQALAAAARPTVLDPSNLYGWGRVRYQNLTSALPLRGLNPQQYSGQSFADALGQPPRGLAANAVFLDEVQESRDEATRASIQQRFYEQQVDIRDGLHPTALDTPASNALIAEVDRLSLEEVAGATGFAPARPRVSG